MNDRPMSPPVEEASTRRGTSPLRRVTALPVIERNVLSYRHIWLILIAGFAEPLFYLLGLGFGLGGLIGDVIYGGRAVDYAVFVAPGMLASAAMNGSIFDMTYNFFYKLKYAKTFEAMLVSPLTMSQILVGEVAWALIRGVVYATGFLVIMTTLGLVLSWWALLAVPASLLIGLAFAAIGSAATTYFRSWQDFDFIQLFLQPLFLASTTFFPLSVYPGWARPIVAATPLYQGVELVRSLCLGIIDWSLLGHVAYLVVVGLVGLGLARRRLGSMLLG